MSRATTRHPADDLITVRDWLRFAVSRFSAARLQYGHGTDNAFDEAAFLILASLDLPIDDLAPWLDCKLTEAERLQIDDIIGRRVSSRKPAAYLINRAHIQGHRFYVDERVIVPRSFIGELLCDGRIAALHPDPGSVTSVLELCTGSGCLAILAALEFPLADVTASDISPDALAVAQQNVDDYRLQSRVHLAKSDLFGGLAPKPYDLLIANPPYVTQASVDAFPPEYRAEPVIAHLGGADGLDIVHRILASARNYLADDGILVVEIGDGKEQLEAALPDLPFLWLETETSSGEVFALSAADLAPKPAAPRRKPRAST